MSDKPVAGITTAIVVLPLVVLCCLGPALFGAALGGAIGWLGGVDPAYALGAAIAAGIAIYSLMRRRRAHSHEPAPHRHATLWGEGDVDDTIKYPFASSSCCPPLPIKTPATEPRQGQSATAATAKSRDEQMAVPAFLHRNSSAPTDGLKPIRLPQLEKIRSELSQQPRRNGR